MTEPRFGLPTLTDRDYEILQAELDRIDEAERTAANRISTEQLKVWLADINGDWMETPEGLSPSFPQYYDSEYGETVEALLTDLVEARKYERFAWLSDFLGQKV